MYQQPVYQPPVYVQPAPMIVGPTPGVFAAEAALDQAERREEAQARRDLMHGNIAGAIRHERNAERLENAEYAVAASAYTTPAYPVYAAPVTGVVGAEVALGQAERREEAQAQWDLRHGNVAGAIRHEQNAQGLRNAEYDVAASAYAAPVYQQPVYYQQADADRCCCTIM